MAYNRSNFPEEYDVFMEKLDIPFTEIDNVLRYQELYAKGEKQTEQEVEELGQLKTRLEQYLLTPEDINYFQDAMTNVQKFFKENTADYVDNLQKETKDYTDGKQKEMEDFVGKNKVELIGKQTETIKHSEENIKKLEGIITKKEEDFNIEVNKFRDLGEYELDKGYYEKNYVHYKGNIYIALEDSKGKNPSNNPDIWRKLTVKGETGYGVGLSPKGLFSLNKTYMLNDLVTYEGRLFRCIEDGVKGIIPDIENEGWILFLEGSGEDLSALQTNDKDSLVGAINEINSKEVDLSPIEKEISEINSQFETVNNTLSETDKSLLNKVDKVDGKQLSTNDFTDSDKSYVNIVKNKADLEYVDKADNLLKSEMAEVKKSVGDGKRDIAQAITSKGVNTSVTSSFWRLQYNIKQIDQGVSPEELENLFNVTSINVGDKYYDRRFLIYDAKTKTFVGFDGRGKTIDMLNTKGVLIKSIPVYRNSYGSMDYGHYVFIAEISDRMFEVYNFEGIKTGEFTKSRNGVMYVFPNGDHLDGQYIYKNTGVEIPSIGEYSYWDIFPLDDDSAILNFGLAADGNNNIKIIRGIKTGKYRITDSRITGGRLYI